MPLASDRFRLGRRLVLSLIGAAALLTGGGAAQARAAGLDCDALIAALGRASGGETFVLGADCPSRDGQPAIRIGKRWSQPVTVDAGKGRVQGLSVSGQGLIWRGGVVVAPVADGKGPAGYAIHLRPGAAHIILEAGLVTEAKRGIVIDRASDIIVRRMALMELTIDGLNVANSQRVRIENNVCESWSTGETHPDCYQGWTRAGFGMSDIWVIGNTARGKVQGIFFGNHLNRKPLPDPGFDRVVIRNNVVRNTYPQGVSISDCRDCEVTDNDVARLPGARFRSNINIGRSTGKFCNNKAKEIAASRPELRRC